MPSRASVGPTVAGKRLRLKIVVALAVSSVLPLLVLVYVANRYLFPGLDPSDGLTFYGLHALLLFTVLGLLTNVVIMWSVGRTVLGIADLLSRDPVGRLDPQAGEVGALMSNVSKVFDTIDAQASEINSFATRLDAAYKELESTSSKLKETSFRDEVTGLYNRRFFAIRLEEEISRHRRFNHPVSVVLLDLDGFKAVNDDLGHAVGDDTLRDVAQILQKYSRGINVVSRYGGDEFAILLVETSKAGARRYAERIRDVVSKFRFAHGMPVTASLGVASLPDDDVATGDDLIKLADEALYAAKRSGKNQVAVLDPASERVS
jgi:diguanylate cyclase (GGDEF)-like protein